MHIDCMLEGLSDALSNNHESMSCNAMASGTDGEGLPACVPTTLSKQRKLHDTQELFPQQLELIDVPSSVHKPRQSFPVVLCEDSGFDEDPSQGRGRKDCKEAERRSRFMLPCCETTSHIPQSVIDTGKHGQLTSGGNFTIFFPTLSAEMMPLNVIICPYSYISTNFEKKATIDEFSLQLASPSEQLTITNPVVQFLSSLQLQGYAGHFFYVYGIHSIEKLLDRIRCEYDAKAILGEYAPRQHQLTLWRGVQKCVRRTQSETNRQRKNKKVRISKSISSFQNVCGHGHELFESKKKKIRRTESLSHFYHQPLQKPRRVKFDESDARHSGSSLICGAFSFKSDTNQQSIVEKESTTEHLVNLESGRIPIFLHFSPEEHLTASAVGVASQSGLLDLSRVDSPTTVYTLPQPFSGLMCLAEGSIVQVQNPLHDLDKAHNDLSPISSYKFCEDSQSAFSSNASYLQAINLNDEYLDLNERSSEFIYVNEKNAVAEQGSRLWLGSEFCRTAYKSPPFKRLNLNDLDPYFYVGIPVESMINTANDRACLPVLDTDVIPSIQEGTMLEKDSDVIDSDWHAILESLKNDLLTFTSTQTSPDILRLHHFNSMYEKKKDNTLSGSLDEPLLLYSQRNVPLEHLVSDGPIPSPWKYEIDLCSTEQTKQATNCNSVKKTNRPAQHDDIILDRYQQPSDLLMGFAHEHMSRFNSSSLDITQNLHDQECFQEVKTGALCAIFPGTSHIDSVVRLSVKELPHLANPSSKQNVEISVSLSNCDETSVEMVPKTYQKYVEKATERQVSSCSTSTVHDAENISFGHFHPPRGDSMNLEQFEIASITSTDLSIPESRIRGDDTNTIDSNQPKLSFANLIDCKHRGPCTEISVEHARALEDFSNSQSQNRNSEGWRDQWTNNQKFRLKKLKPKPRPFFYRSGSFTKFKLSNIAPESVEEESATHPRLPAKGDINTLEQNCCLDELMPLSYSCKTAKVNAVTYAENLPLEEDVELLTKEPFKEAIDESTVIISRTKANSGDTCSRDEVTNSIVSTGIHTHEPFTDSSKNAMDSDLFSKVNEKDYWEQFGLQGVESIVDMTQSAISLHPSCERAPSTTKRLSSHSTPFYNKQEPVISHYLDECLKNQNKDDQVDVITISDTESAMEDDENMSMSTDESKRSGVAGKINTSSHFREAFEPLITDLTTQSKDRLVLSHALCLQSGGEDETRSTAAIHQRLIALYEADPSLAQLTLSDLRIWCGGLGLPDDVGFPDNIEQHDSTISQPRKCCRCLRLSIEEKGNDILLDNKLLGQSEEYTSFEGGQNCMHSEVVRSDALRAQLRLMAVRVRFYDVVAPRCLHRVERVSGLPYRSIRISDLLTQQERYMLTHTDLENTRQRIKKTIQDETERCIVASLAAEAALHLERRVLEDASAKNDSAVDLRSGELVGRISYTSGSCPSVADDAVGLSLYEQALIFEAVDVQSMVSVVQRDFPFISHTRVQQMLEKCDLPLRTVRQVNSTQFPSLDPTRLNNSTACTHEKRCNQLFPDKVMREGMGETKKEDFPFGTGSRGAHLSPFSVSHPNPLPAHQVSSPSLSQRTAVQTLQGQKRCENSRRFFASCGRWRGQTGH